MGSNGTSSAADPLQQVIAGCRSELAGLYAEVAADEAKKMRRWQDESPMLESYIQALTGTREILQRETKQLTTEIANLKAFLDKKAAAEAAKQDPALAGSDVTNLRGQLADLQARLADLDQQLTEVVGQLAGPAGQAVRAEERSIYETKLVVLQDTRRLLQSEAAAVSAELKRRESAARLESDKHSAAELGLSDLGRLTEQLAATEAKLDRAKVDTYFPKIKGFRFSGGGNGVYFACKDLHLCEVSAAFSLELEALPAQQQQQQGTAAPGGQLQQQVRLKLTLSGISSSSTGQEFKQQQQAHEQQQHAKAAARATSLKRMQSQQQQQQQPPSALYRSNSTAQAPVEQQPSATSSSAAGSSTTVAAASANGSHPLQQPLPEHMPAGSSMPGSSAAADRHPGTDKSAAPLASAAAAAGAAGLGPAGVPGGSGSSRRGAAVAKFIGQLSERKDSLKQAIKAASDDGAAGNQQAALQQHQRRDGRPEPPGGGGFSRLAGAFNDKAAAFGERVSHVGLLGSASGADSEPDLAGLGLAGLPVTPRDISRQGSGVPLRSESASSDALEGAAAAAGVGDVTLHTAAGAGTPQATGSSRIAGGSGSNISAQPVADPAGTSSSSLRSSAEFASSPGQFARQGSSLAAAGGRLIGGSSPGGSTGHEHDGQLRARLANRMEGMKGKLGGLLTDGKQKLADSKQKLQSSKLLNESKAAAKHLLADSKVLLEEGKAGFKTKLSNISSKLDEHLHHQHWEQQQLQAQQQWEQYQQRQQHQGLGQHILAQQQQPPLGQQAAAAAAAGMEKAAAGSDAAAQLAEQPPGQQQQQALPLQEGANCDGADCAVHKLQLQSQSLCSSQSLPVSHPASSTGGDAAATTPAAAATWISTSSSTDPAAGATAGGGPAAASPETGALAAADAGPAPQSFVAASSSFPGVAAAAAAAASTGDLDRQLLDEAWARDEDGGVGGLARGGSGSAAGAAAAAAAAGVAGAKGSAGRRGVAVMLLAEGLEVIGEKGTKVPNIRAAQLGLEVEACLSATLTYSPMLGWQSSGLSFEVLSLERVVQGSNLPLPKTLIKSLLNVVMPSVFTKLLMTSLPHELGKFILDSSAAAAAAAASRNGSRPGGGSSSNARQGLAAAGPAGVWLAGEVSLAGPPASCLSANLTRTSGDIPKGRADIRDFVKELRTAQKARALLDLPEPRHAKALALLFNPGPYSLLPGASGLMGISPAPGPATTPAAAAAAGPTYAGSASLSGGSTAGISSSSAAALGSGLSVTLNDLCKFYLAYSESGAWERVCGVWQAAVDAVCQQLAQQEGLLTAAAAAAELQDDAATASSNGNHTPGSSSGSDSTGNSGGSSSRAAGGSPAVSFNFAGLMGGRVAGLVRKPVRLSCGLRQLLLSLDVGAGLAAARDYCERAAREFAENAKGEDALLLLQRPLSMQLELLHLWHAALSAQLAAFAQQFRGAHGRLLLAADRACFSVAAEGCSYEGPLRLELPLPLLADLAAGACVWDLALRDPCSAVPTLASKIRFVAAALAKAAFGTCEDEQEVLREAAAAEALAAIAAAGDAGHNIEVPITQAAELEALLAAWSQQALQQQPAAAKSAGNAAGLLLRRSSLPRSNSAAPAPVATPAAAAQAAGTPATAGAAAHAGGQEAAAAATGGVADSGSIGRVLLSRLSMGLVLDERRLQELLAGGIKDANLVGGLLGCFGQLFTATLAPGWQKGAAAGTAGSADQLSRSSSSTDAATVIASVGARDGSSSAEEKNRPRQKVDNRDQKPCGMLTVKNNDITRVRAELESASFVSAVPPRIAVRLLHIVALAVVLKFLNGGSSKRLQYVNKVFGHIAEYLGRDCLDLLLCLDVAAATSEAGGLQVSVGVAPAADSGSSSSGAAAAGGVGATNGGCSSPSWPVYVINDVNLLTVLDTVKLIMDYSS